MQRKIIRICLVASLMWMVVGQAALARTPKAPSAGPVVVSWSVNPWAIPTDGWTQTAITATITDSQGAITQATIDLSALGGSATASLYDDGLHNDGAAHDNLYGLITTATTGSAQGEIPLTLTATDQQGNTATQSLGTFAALTPLTNATWPSSLPSFLGWGTFDNNFQSNTGLSWNYQSQFLNWNWITWNPNYVATAAQAAWNDSYIPVFTVYMLLNAAGCNGLAEEECTFAHLQNATVMQGYFDRVTQAAQQANGQKPVLFHLEPDASADLQRYTLDYQGQNGIVADDPNSLPALSLDPNYPNTYAGVVHRLIDIIHQHAPNALVSLHARSWATGPDVAGSTNPNLDVDSVSQRTASFLTAASGPALDLLFADWKTDDAGSGLSPWWDSANTALPHFNRILHWQNRLAYYSGRRMMIWKMPAGNMNLPNTACVNNVATHQDNRVDYAYAHPRDLLNAGINGVIVGGGTCDTSPSNDGGNIMAKAVAYYAAPSTPTGFSASVVNNGHGVIQASWSPIQDMNLWRYRLYYGRTPSTLTSYLDSGDRTSIQTVMPGGGQWYVAAAAYSVAGRVSVLSSPISLAVDQPYQVYLPLLKR